MRLSLSGAVALHFLLGCSSSPPPAQAPKPPEPCAEPRPTILLAGGEHVNAGADGRGLPVQVRLYQLASEAKLSNAFFDEVWKNDAKTLEGDLLSMREVTVFPGKTEQLELEQVPEARVLSAVALFRDPRGKDWHVNYDLALAKQEPPCPPARPRISIWLDRMKIQDGEGRVEATGEAPAEPATSQPASGQDK